MTPLASTGGLILGIIIGIISGMIGIGGGAFLIPTLIFFCGMSQKTVLFPEGSAATGFSRRASY